MTSLAINWLENTKLQCRAGGCILQPRYIRNWLKMGLSPGQICHGGQISLNPTAGSELHHRTTQCFSFIPDGTFSTSSHKRGEQSTPAALSPNTSLQLLSTNPAHPALSCAPSTHWERRYLWGRWQERGKTKINSFKNFLGTGRKENFHLGC